jgi:hypothetical protein
MLRQGLNFTPGTRYAYSNIGYLVLGKVLEAITHQRYEAWVQQHVLVPSGVREAHLAHNLPTARLERESDYQSGYRMLSCYNTGERVPAAYGGYQVEAMNSHGGWLFSARDLVRLVSAADGFASRPDLLSNATLRSMVQPSDVACSYAKGWMVDGSSWWHSGLLDGTASLVVRTASGYNWAILLNTSTNSAQFWNDLYALGGHLLAGTTSWPTHDLFAPDQNATSLRATVLDSARKQLTWVAGNGTHRLVLLKADSPSTAFPSDGTAYPLASALADGTLVVANGTATSAALPPLDPQRTYYARVVEYRQDATTGNQPVYTLDGNPSLALHPNTDAEQQPLLAVYPNPVLGELRVDGALTSLPYKLTTPQGSLLQEGTLTPERTISVRQLPPGMYLLRVREAEQESVLRFVKE